MSQCALERAEELRATYGGLDGLALLRALLCGGPLQAKTALVSSFGAESVVLLDMVATIDRAIPVIFLDTGKLFQATHAYREQLTRLLALRDVRIVRPDALDLVRGDPAERLWQSNPDSCCHLRKTEPLERALDGFAAWITGRKRFHGGPRHGLSTIEGEPSTGRIKLNPLATWQRENVEHYRRLRDLPAHPLHAEGYRSIGCTPCTRSVQPGEPPRAGRWWWLDKSECGIHRLSV